jgi:23S rRNA (uridine2552-2'-O)-methyltransferase
MIYRRKDPYYRRARTEGYRARSAYKLAELSDRFRLLRRGDLVVDLGAWPGGWLQVALERVGPEGAVFGVDAVEVEPLSARNVHLVTGDVRDPATVRELGRRIGRPADIVLSDMAPKLTGVGGTDEARCAELVDAVAAALPTLLRPGGLVLTKVFMGPGYEAALRTLRGLFAEVRVTRPEATRHGSAELYAFGRGYRPGKA